LINESNEKDKNITDKNSSELLKNEDHQKLLNEKNRENSLNEFTNVNEFENKIITKKIVLNSKEENIANVSKTNENYSTTPNKVNSEDFSNIINSPVLIDDEKINKENKEKRNTIAKESDNSKESFNSNNNTSLKSNILNLKKPKLSNKKKGN